ncbi:MAG: CPBP family intramembrane metalloprotease [Luteimonas sp.]|nr:CPBP family intramembrane metalloprotease [Luteimonas sp.]
MFQSAITPAQGIELGPVALALTVALVAWLVVGEAVSGRISFRRFLADLAAGVPDARRKLYLGWSRWSWMMAAGVLLLAMSSPGFGLERLGIAWPRWSSLAEASAGSSFVKGLLIGMVLMIVVSIVAGAIAVNRMRKADGTGAPAAANDAVAALLPTTTGERRGYAFLSLTAGVTEEITQRGFLLAAMVALLPPMPALAYILIGGAVFGLGHAYQGRSGVVATGLIGALFMGIYLATGSLLIPIVLHVLMDLNGLRVPLARDTPAGD